MAMACWLRGGLMSMATSGRYAARAQPWRTCCKEEGMDGDAAGQSLRHRWPGLPWLASSTWSASRPASRDTPVKENSGKIAGQPRRSSGATGGLTRAGAVVATASAAAGARRRKTVEVVARSASRQAGMGGGQQADGGSDGAIVWDAARRRFQTPDGLAYLEYQEPRRDVMDLVHTYVPASKRGGGVAGQLCKAACAHARERNLRIVPTCSYVSDTFLPRNPEWRGLVYDAAGAKEQQQQQQQGQ